VISAQSFDTAKTAFDSTRTSRDVAMRAVDVAVARLALAQRNLDDTVVRAPFTGIVTVKAAQEARWCRRSPPAAASRGPVSARSST